MNLEMIIPYIGYRKCVCCEDKARYVYGIYYYCKFHVFIVESYGKGKTHEH